VTLGVADGEWRAHGGEVIQDRVEPGCESVLVEPVVLPGTRVGDRTCVLNCGQLALGFEGLCGVRLVRTL
jgi:hypothetical protein